VTYQSDRLPSSLFVDFDFFRDSADASRNWHNLTTIKILYMILKPLQCVSTTNDPFIERCRYISKWLSEEQYTRLWFYNWYRYPRKEASWYSSTPLQHQDYRPTQSHCKDQSHLPWQGGHNENGCYSHGLHLWRNLCFRTHLLPWSRFDGMVGIFSLPLDCHALVPLETGTVSIVFRVSLVRHAIHTAPFGFRWQLFPQLHRPWIRALFRPFHFFVSD